MPEPQHHEFLEAVRRQLPLLIERAEFANQNLSLGGPLWSFNALATWRCIAGGRLVAASEDTDGASAFIETVVGRAISRVVSQSSLFPFDPTFILDHGVILEVFSSHFLDPWVMHLPEPPVWVAAPGAA
jgi:hypothetical protein